MKKKYCLIITILLFLSTFSNAESFKYHTIKDGETLWRISKNYNVTMDELCKINKISDATKVKQGEKIKIPCKNATVQKSNTSSNNAKQPVAQTKSVNQNATKKTVSIITPMNGSIKPFITPNIKGIIIFAQNQQIKDKVVSIDAGTVSFIDDLAGYGLSVLIKHPNNMLSIYSGFDNVNVKKGDAVTKGQLIGNAGRLAKFDKVGIVFSIQKNKEFLKYDINAGKFVE